MPLTPADVHNVAFKKPPIGKRGYDEDEVDAFLDLVEAELARLIEENADLKSQLADLDRAGPPQRIVEERPPPVAPTPAPFVPPAAPTQAVGEQDDHSRASRVLALATETADRHVHEAKAQADQMVNEARSSSEKVLGDAKAKSDQLLGEARSKSEGLLSDAKNRSEAVERDARTKAATLTQDAERRQSEILGNLEQQKGALEKRIDELRSFEREYRTRLKSYLETQLRDLEGKASAEPSPDGQRPGGYGAVQQSNG
ncbi:cell wall synthesis protein Wag31 [soil metagenome]